MRGALLGLEHATDRAAAARAVLEGVAFALADCRDALAATGTTLDSLVAVGGGSRSDYWLRVVATVLDTPLSVPEAGDFGAAFGAARLGLMAATGESSAATPPRIHRTVDPDPSLVAAFRDGHAAYRAAARAILELA